MDLALLTSLGTNLALVVGCLAACGFAFCISAALDEVAGRGYAVMVLLVVLATLALTVAGFNR